MNHAPAIAEALSRGYSPAMDLTDLLATPDVYLHSFDAAEAVLLPMTRAAYRQSIFLDHRIAPTGPGGWRVPSADLPASAPPAQPADWILHVAHCGSTLFARALEALSDRLVLREPLALRQLAIAPDPGLLPATVALLARRYPAAGPTLIKANVPVNFILPALGDVAGPLRGIVIHARLEDYLIAVLRSEHHRGWVRSITTLLGAHFGSLDGLNDGERAAALWLTQHQRLGEATARHSALRTLDAEVLFADPTAALRAAAAHLQIAATPAMIADLVAGPLFRTYSKNPALAFDNAARTERNAALAAQLDPEISSARAWLERQQIDPEQLQATLTARAMAG